MAGGHPTSTSRGASNPLKRPPVGYQPRQQTLGMDGQPAQPVQPPSPGQQPGRIQYPPRVPLSDPFVSPRLGLSPKSSFITPSSAPVRPGHIRVQPWPSLNRPACAHSQPVQVHRLPKWALPAPQKYLPFTIPHNKFVQYMRKRPNVRVYACPVLEVFPKRFEPPRAAHGVLERILCLFDIRNILRCQRVSKQFTSTIHRSSNLQRRLWYIDTQSPVTLPDDSNYIDPVILELRNEFDLFLDCVPGSHINKVLYAPDGGPLKLKHSRISSWRRMSILRTGERGKYWQVVIAGVGLINLGTLGTSPSFGYVVDAVTDALVHGGQKYRVIPWQDMRT